jgi:succinate-semialdehyde dehydrogenase/glutarate-semialdehyde dehydrogenase
VKLCAQIARYKLADLIDERTEDLAKIASQEMGKLIAPK